MMCLSDGAFNAEPTWDTLIMETKIDAVLSRNGKILSTNIYISIRGSVGPFAFLWCPSGKVVGKRRGVSNWLERHTSRYL